MYMSLYLSQNFTIELIIFAKHCIYYKYLITTHTYLYVLKEPIYTIKMVVLFNC